VELLDNYYMYPSPKYAFRFEASGTIAEIIQFIGSEVTPKLEYIFNLIERGLNDQYCFIRSNFAFLAGVLCENCGAPTFKYYELILNGVSPLFQEDTEMKVRDNAASCVSRLMNTNPNNFPFQEVLPTFFSALPIVEDFDENYSVYGALIKLINDRHNAILPFIPNIIDLFSYLLSDSNVQNDLKSEIAKTLKSILQTFSEKDLKPIIDKLSKQQINMIEKLYKNNKKDLHE